MNAEDMVRRYLKAADNQVSRPLVRGENGERLLAAVASRLAGLGAIQWEPVGSVSCQTSVAPYSDVDMLAVFLDPIRHGLGAAVLPYSTEQLRRHLSESQPRPAVPDAGAAFDLVLECLDDIGPMFGFDPPLGDFPAVRFVPRSGGPAIEVVPGIEADALWDERSTAPTSGLVRVAFPAQRERWLGTEPRLHSSVLDLAQGGRDYSPRELIRLLKLIKYRRCVPVLSYYLELFALRWLEGSEAFAATSISSIVEQHGIAWSSRQTGYLADDLPALTGALIEQLRAPSSNGPITMIDLTTPEELGTVQPYSDTAHARTAANLFETIAAEAQGAQLAAREGNPKLAIARWRKLLHEG